MPTYEYECQSCSIRFERMQHFKDEPLKDCPECGGSVRRVLQPVGIIFKGSGFYSTDHQLTAGSARPHKELQAPKQSENEKSSLGAENGSKPATKEAANSRPPPPSVK